MPGRVGWVAVMEASDVNGARNANVVAVFTVTQYCDTDIREKHRFHFAWLLFTAAVYTCEPSGAVE